MTKKVNTAVVLCILEFIGGLLLMLVSVFAGGLLLGLVSAIVTVMAGDSALWAVLAGDVARWLTGLLGAGLILDAVRRRYMGWPLELLGGVFLVVLLAFEAIYLWIMTLGGVWGMEVGVGLPVLAGVLGAGLIVDAANKR